MVVVEPGSITLVTGPARGGKSRWAEHLASSSGMRVHYLATAEERPFDSAWQARLEQHRRRRPSTWTLHTPGDAMVTYLPRFGAADLLLVDALGTWLARHLEQQEQDWRQHQDQLIAMLKASPAAIVLVAEETGWGVVPSTAIGGLFRDRMGHLLEQLHRVADASWLVLHGRALNLLALSVGVPED